MKENIDVVPLIFRKFKGLSAKMLYGFTKMGKVRIFPKHDYHYNHMKNLSLVYFNLTPLCNLRCKMCGQWGDRGKMKNGRIAEKAKAIVSLERYKEIIDEIAPCRPVTYLWGGEPFLYPDLMPLAKYIVEKGLYMSVNTNGTFLEQYAEQIVRDKWSTIFVSLDAFEETNDAMRGKGSYQKVARGFEALNREKKHQNSNYPIMGIVSTVTNQNYLTLAELAEASRAFNLDLHIFNLGTYTNDNIVSTQKRFMKEKLDTDVDCLAAYNTGYNLGIDGEKLNEILANIQSKDYGHPIITVPSLNPRRTHTYYAELETPVRRHCIVPWCQTNVNYNGDVHFCADYPDYILGNVKEQSFTEIYNGERANRFRRAIHTSKDGMFPGCLRCYQNMLFGMKIKGF
ncbi:MAG: radical SAM protein [Treponema sp.]|jgi:radical SAM protein with 4Fe4S-binding SPASM domain|nr:radical SAM protein [Treponema sp.]